jgi:parallel beta-helix repeat protein
LVLVDKPLTLEGQSAIIDASGPTPAAGSIVGIAVTSSAVRVEGFIVTGAVDEGILAEPPAALAAGGSETPASPVAPITHVTISGNTATGNNAGFVPPFGCTLASEYAGDCGGGIHFNAVVHSNISNNVVSNNADGILMTDEAGPDAHNTVAGNYVVYNVYECGITLPSHNGAAASFSAGPGGLKVTKLNPSLGGVYNNTIRNNVSDNNGTAGFRLNVAGSGGGIGLFTPSPGTAVYNNVIKANSVTGNGLAGVVIHAHYIGLNPVSGNQIIGNRIGKNNVAGDTLDYPWSSTDMTTTGILVLSAGAIKLKISGNQISGNAIGIWRNRAVKTSGSNTYSGQGHSSFSPDVPFGSAFCVPVLFAPQNCQQATAPDGQLNGFVVPNGSSTTYYFRWGTDKASLSNTTPVLNAGSGATPVVVSANITGLAAATTYYFELVIQNGHGTTTGAEQSFSTK